MKLKGDANFEEKLTFCLKNGMKNLVNFNSSSGKSENLHFNELILSKVRNVWAIKNTDELYREKWLFISKITWGIWWSFKQVVESNVK